MSVLDMELKECIHDPHCSECGADVDENCDGDTNNCPKLRTGQFKEARIYVASRASILERGAMWRSFRDRFGVPIISTWIDEDGENDTADLDELWVRICHEVTTASFLVLYAEPNDFPLKGAFVEIGMALAANVPVRVVAPMVEVSGRNCRPFGSWVKHPLVTFFETPSEAFAT